MTASGESMTALVPPLAIEPDGSLGPIASTLTVFVAGWIVTGVFLFVVWRLFVHRGRAMRAESAADAIGKARQPLPESGPVLVAGIIEVDGRGPALRMEIEQRGKEWSAKESWSHEWREESRTVHAQPFRLRLSDGTSLRVDPDDRVRLVVSLKTEKYDSPHRRRVAELPAGASVWVSGELSREGQTDGKTTAYRTAVGGPVLRGTRFEPLEIATGKLDTQFAYWRGFYRRAVAAVGVVLFAVHGVLFGHYYAALWLGRPVEATVVKATSYTTSSKRGPVWHYEVHATLPSEYGGQLVTDEVDYRVYELAKHGDLKKVTFMVVRALPVIHSIGGYADLGIWSAIGACVAAIVTPLLFLQLRSAAVPWYEQRRVLERGSGRLATKAWDAQVPGQRGLFVRTLPPIPE